jgi:serine/threonine protein phosphatase PrpC
MAELNAYEELGVSQNASAEEVKKAYKSLAQKYHPEKRTPSVEALAERYPNLSDEALKEKQRIAREVATDDMKKINVAYGKIDTPEKRTAYDSDLRNQGYKQPPPKNDPPPQPEAKKYDGHGYKEKEIHGDGFRVDYAQTPDSQVDANGKPVRQQARYAGNPNYDSGQQDRSFVIRDAPEINEQNMRNIFSATNAEMKNDPKFKQSGATASIAQVSKDGMLTVANVGDAPVHVYVRDPKTGNVVDTLDIARAHTPDDPAEIARIQKEGGYVANGRLNGNLAVSRALGDHADVGISAKADIGRVDLNQYFKKGYEVVVVAGSDGVMEGTNGNMRANVVENAGKNKNIAAHLVELADKNGATDNVTALAMTLKKPPKENVTLAVFDGHGKNGAAAAQLASDQFKQKIHVDIRAGRDIKGEYDSTAPKSSANPQKTIDAASWTNVTDSSGKPALYANIDKMSGQERADLESALKAKGVEYNIKHSSMDGGTNVIAVGGDQYDKMFKSSADVNAIAKQAENAKNKIADDIANRTDGAARVTFDADGTMKVHVDSTYSRSTLAQKLGISNPDALDRVGVNNHTDAIIIRPDQMPSNYSKMLSDATELKSSWFKNAFDNVKGFGKHAGVIAPIVIGTTAAGISMATGSSTAEAGETLAETAIPYGETAIEAAKGNTQQAKNAAIVETASNVGSVAGGVIGATAAQAAGARAGGMIAAGLVGSTGVGIAVAVVAAIGMEKIEELEAKGRMDYLKGGKVDTYEEVAALKGALLTDPASPLPQSIKIDGKDMSIEQAIREQPDKLKEAMKDSPEALQTIQALQTLDDYGKKFLSNSITPGTEVPIQVMERKQATPSTQPAPS